ncbi:disulfide bond formation protein B [Solimicrobium silvestre]|uniref:Disulfide bond formation protein B n=1 Tax=Solimicrobium silvestre TaxID=2099400 RepID=A0A2S9H2M0_9BURK|nr:disulfide bond formation protein B [Solimicrobium silvestre]PRC94235.1 Disulfide bond formation protein DsbB [Solimicrobium silvestre]
MKKTQIALLITAIASLAIVGGALYFQIVERMPPCPLCIIQRYAFILLAIGSLIGMAGPALLRKIGCCLGLYASISGAGVALHQLYVIAHPDIKCGIDPVQTAVNSLPFASWLPTVFSAEGLCGTPYDPFFGLVLPQWSLLWFVVFTVVLLLVLFKSKKQ